ncbi:MAG: hypothetical protein GXO83_03880 [Chlorobi bacterium]|nr:hypothetical protein [Chlorobiota bacterium]
METEKNISNIEESLEIINKMIFTAKVNIKGGSFYFLFWGWLIILISLGVFSLEKFTNMMNSEVLWSLTFVGVIVSGIYGYKKEKKEKFTTYTGNIYMWVWLGFLIVVAGLIFIIIYDKAYTLIGPVILLLAGYATLLSGIIIKFKPLIIGALFMWTLGITAFFIHNEYALIVEAFAVLCGYLIPGYMLKNKKDDENI